VLWVTRRKPHVDRCASAWLIKRFIDKDAKFQFIRDDDPIPEGAIAFTLPSAEIRPIKGRKTTYDVLAKEYHVHDPCALILGQLIHDFEVDAEEDPRKVRYRETMGLCHVLRGLEKTSETDHETIRKGFMVLDAFRALIRDEALNPQPFIEGAK
jgi:hypothetical protein